MATTLPLPSQPPFGPPTSALPPLPTIKTRKSLPTPSQVPRAPSTSQIPSKLAIRTPSRATIPNAASKPHHAASTPSIPTLRTTSTTLKRESSPTNRSIRKTISIASFPQPPKGSSRIATISGGSSLSVSPVLPSPSSFRRGSSDSTSPSTSGGSIRVKKLKTSNEHVGQPHFSYNTPSLLNGTGEGKSISAGVGERPSDMFLGLPSPAHSRSSSAQGSYSTTATTFEDVDENPRRGRENAEEMVDSGKRHSSTKEGKGNVIVSVRVRPDAGGGSDDKSDGEWMVDGRRSLVAFRGREGGDYYYDNVFATHDKNDKVYDASAKRLVRRVMDGYHGTVFAYGMTGTGKTFSMQGTATSPGVIPLAITDIFSYIRETPHREFLLRVSYLEIYNEKIHDLLAPPAAGGIGSSVPQQEEIKLREDSKRGVYASPLKEEIVQSPTQLLRVIARGDHSRRTGSTQYNTRSSRSHAVVQIVVESRERASVHGSVEENKRAPITPGGVRVSTLSLIDLAGSERAAENKDRRTEGAHINKSLLTLGTVIARLSGDKDKNGSPTDKDGKHLPYRDSKLTRLLQPALSGNSLVSILCTIQIGSIGSAAAANGHTGETLNTLKFAARAKNNIVSHAKKSEEALGTGSDGESRVLLERYRMEIESLRAQLENQVKVLAEKEEKQLEMKAEQRHGERMLEIHLGRSALKDKIDTLNRLILCSQSIGVNTDGSLSSPSLHPRLAAYGTSELGSRSIRSSASHSTLGARTSSIHRTVSVASTTTISPQFNNFHSPTLAFDKETEDDTVCHFADGTATLQAQNRALQADLADKNRYISTLEKRLLQARRSSHSRTSIAFASSAQQKRSSSISGEGEDGSNGPTTLQEKDAEIADLKTRLEDQERMLTALRSAAQERDGANASSDPTLPVYTTKGTPNHQSNDSHGSSITGNISLSPVELLSSPQKERKRELDRDLKRKSVDEMSRILDEMIQDRVESGQLIRSGKGSVRIVTHRRTESVSTVPGVVALAHTLMVDEQPRVGQDGEQVTRP